eukprot:CAMPEP_0174264014 /NCGR_PEP_ID=MMETSP0439-20130205/20992_1 /TAXON_ID=0 /ORGANISM="Stereomyxa ramosa, Strain Chinc5" /LENGTH=125 /DNA_ID=CAMNT_0015349697 /DNA_START=17 /DNA_END=391 /DNA_ORIENTATION=+
MMMENYDDDDFEVPKDSLEEKSTEKEEVYDTLDDPVWKTILTDLWSIINKLLHVLVPIRLECKKERKYLPIGIKTRFTSLRNWDLWGPLLLSLILAVILTFASDKTPDLEKQDAAIFGGVFVIIW